MIGRGVLTTPPHGLFWYFDVRRLVTPTLDFAGSLYKHVAVKIICYICKVAALNLSKFNLAAHETFHTSDLQTSMVGKMITIKIRPYATAQA